MVHHHTNEIDNCDKYMNFLALIKKRLKFQYSPEDAHQY